MDSNKGRISKILRFVNTPNISRNEWWGVWEVAEDERCIGICDNINEISTIVNISTVGINRTKSKCKTEQGLISRRSKLRGIPHYAYEISDELFSESWKCNGYIVSRFVEVG